MPLVFRSMKRDGELPMVGAGKTMLGVDPHADIPVTAEEQVRPGTGGMSVAPGWRHLPYHRIPKRLRRFVPRATGNNNYYCWQLGDGPFVDGPLAENLILRRDAARHGVVEPAVEMSIHDYQTTLAATRDQWSIIAEDQS